MHLTSSLDRRMHIAVGIGHVTDQRADVDQLTRRRQTIRARNRLKVVAPMPAKPSSTPIAAFRSASTLVPLEGSASRVLS